MSSWLFLQKSAPVLCRLHGVFIKTLALPLALRVSAFVSPRFYKASPFIRPISGAAIFRAWNSSKNGEQKRLIPPVTKIIEGPKSFKSGELLRRSQRADGA